MPKIKSTRRAKMERAGYVSITAAAYAFDVNRVTIYRWAERRLVRSKREMGCIWVHAGDVSKKARG